MGKFSDHYPKINVSVTESNSVELEKKIASEEIDMIIDSFGEEKNTYELLPLIEEKILLAVPAKFKINDSLEKYRILPEEIYKNTYMDKEKISVKKFENEKFLLLKKVCLK